MDQSVARRIACANHRGQRTRFGGSVIEHISHVAAAVPAEARAVAWLHDLFELTSLGPEHLRPDGFTPVEERALCLGAAVRRGARVRPASGGARELT
jgi:hypothetical protein